jgi:hypothetical protein
MRLNDDPYMKVELLEKKPLRTPSSQSRQRQKPHLCYKNFPASAEAAEQRSLKTGHCLGVKTAPVGPTTAPIGDGLSGRGWSAMSFTLALWQVYRFTKTPQLGLFILNNHLFEFHQAENRATDVAFMSNVALVNPEATPDLSVGEAARSRG